MIIKEISIEKFRGFRNVQFNLGKHLTVIAGQNGTQKTTLLGILSQPFSITDNKNPMYNERPLCGGNFKSAFGDKFKLSEVFDKAKNHEWTLKLFDKPDFTVESIARKASGEEETIRFWKKGDRSRGAGYIQLPVIYLSLSRLLPIGEDESIDSSNEVVLSQNEFEFYQEWHNKILCIPDVDMVKADYLKSKQKNTLGANTEFYDWKMNSAGQDNIGKILLAILSFKRLSENYNGDYNGGILAIDELDATLYPASQVKLLDALCKFAAQYKIQLIFTTHSLTILNQACKMQAEPKRPEQMKVIFLEKSDRKIKIIEDINFDAIKHKLNVTLGSPKTQTKIIVFTEDKEAQVFLKSLLKRKTANFRCLDCSLGCENLIELSKKKIPGFKFPDSLIVLDGDVKKTKIAKLSNILLLPGDSSPERILAKFLYELTDESAVWNKIATGYTKQICFNDFTIKEIRSDRDKAKKWFQFQSKHWGKGCVKAINPWIDANREEVDNFRISFQVIQEKFAKALSMAIS
jgi:energy-coupling factor transporter ATP-binding protein EcfA2